jgi:hypothetical protein
MALSAFSLHKFALNILIPEMLALTLIFVSQF